MFLIGAVLLLTPTFVYLLDQTSLSVPGDPLTWSLILGIAGLFLLGISQRHDVRRALISTVFGLVLLGVQLYIIALYVLDNGNVT